MATKKDKKVEEPTQEDQNDALEMLLEASAKEPPDNRLIALFGEIDEAKAGQLCFNLCLLASDKRYSAINPDDLNDGLKETVDPIQLMICSPGGNASEMFAIYDTMRVIRRECDIETFGGFHGGIHNVENEMDEIRWIQEQYIKMLAEESDVSRAQLKKLLQRKVNVYLSAEEAIEMGLADIIV